MWKMSLDPSPRNYWLQDTLLCPPPQHLDGIPQRTLNLFLLSVPLPRANLLDTFSPLLPNSMGLAWHFVPKS